MIHGKNLGQSGKKRAEVDAAGVSQKGYDGSVTNGAILATDIDAKDGLYIVSDDTNTKSAIIAVHSGTVSAVVSGDASISATKATAAKLNVYVETGVIKVQNNLAATVDVTIKSYA